MLEQHRPALGDGVVAEPPFLRREGGGREGEVLGVPRLVEERPPVAGPALRLHHEDDAAGHLDRRAERPRILVRALVEVELDVLLPVQVDAEVGEGDLEGRQHAVGREGGVPVGAAPGASHVRALDLVQPQPDARPEEAFARLRPEALRVREQAAALLREVVQREAEAAVQVGVIRRAQPPCLALDDLRRLQLERVQVLLGELVPRLFDPRPDVAVLLVHQSRPEHPVRDLLAVDRRRQRRLELGDPLCLLAHEVAEIALARELP